MDSRWYLVKMFLVWGSGLLLPGMCVSLCNEMQWKIWDGSLKNCVFHPASNPDAFPLVAYLTFFFFPPQATVLNGIPSGSFLPLVLCKDLAVGSGILICIWPEVLWSKAPRSKLERGTGNFCVFQREQCVMWKHICFCLNSSPCSQTPLYWNYNVN